MDNQEQQRKQALDETLERAGAFEEMVNTKGWEWVKAYYQVQVQTFTSNMLTSDQDVETFEARRQQLKGMRDLMNMIQGDLDTLYRFRKEQDERSTDKADR